MPPPAGPAVRLSYLQLLPQVPEENGLSLLLPHHPPHEGLQRLLDCQTLKTLGLWVSHATRPVNPDWRPETIASTTCYPPMLILLLVHTSPSILAIGGSPSISLVVVALNTRPSSPALEDVELTGAIFVETLQGERLDTDCWVNLVTTPAAFFSSVPPPQEFSTSSSMYFAADSSSLATHTVWALASEVERTVLLVLLGTCGNYS